MTIISPWETSATPSGNDRKEACVKIHLESNFKLLGSHNIDSIDLDMSGNTRP